jgi:hypothetical protein
MRHNLIFIGLFASAVMATSIAEAQPTKTIQPGMALYTPTRIEWLTLNANAELRKDVTIDSRFYMAFVASDHETITIFVRYHPSEDRETINYAVRNAKEIISAMAKSRNWDKWLKISEKVEMFRVEK